MATQEQISELFQRMAYPSTQVFYNQLKRRGIPVTLKMVTEFVKSRSERQVSAPGPKFQGKIVAFDINHKWATDCISFVNRGVKTNDGEMKYVLICQDIFSRKIWTRPMIELSQVTYFFEDILQDSELFDSDGNNQYVDQLTSDGGTEFTNENFDLFNKIKS